MKLSFQIFIGLIVLGVSNVSAGTNPFRTAVEVGRSVEPGGSLDVGYLKDGQFAIYRAKGLLTRHIYRLPTNQSREEVFREIEAMLVKDNYSLLVTQGPLDPKETTIEIDEVQLYRDYDEDKMFFTEDREMFTVIYDPDQKGGYYLSARRHQLDKDTYAVASLSNARNFMQVDVVEIANWVVPAVREKVEVASRGDEIEVVETVQLTTDRIQLEMEAKGHVNIYGILFDIDSAVIRPESQFQISVIAEYLKLFPQFSFYVVGHTSDTGTFEHNIKLSVDRAKAVMDTLVQQYGIEPARLAGYGVGPAAPVDSNFTSPGRAHNRRVVLIRRLPES